MFIVYIYHFTMTQKQNRVLGLLADFDFDIYHIFGSYNQATDSLSEHSASIELGRMVLLERKF